MIKSWGSAIVSVSDKPVRSHPITSNGPSSIPDEGPRTVPRSATSRWKSSVGNLLVEGVATRLVLLLGMRVCPEVQRDLATCAVMAMRWQKTEYASRARAEVQVSPFQESRGHAGIGWIPDRRQAKEQLTFAEAKALIPDPCIATIHHCREIRRVLPDLNNLSSSLHRNLGL